MGRLEIDLKKDLEICKLTCQEQKDEIILLKEKLAEFGGLVELKNAIELRLLMIKVGLMSIGRKTM